MNYQLIVWMLALVCSSHLATSQVSTLIERGNENQISNYILHLNKSAVKSTSSNHLRSSEDYLLSKVTIDYFSGSTIQEASVADYIYNNDFQCELVKTDFLIRTMPKEFHIEYDNKGRVEVISDDMIIEHYKYDNESRIDTIYSSLYHNQGEEHFLYIIEYFNDGQINILKSFSQDDQKQWYLRSWKESFREMTNLKLIKEVSTWTDEMGVVVYYDSSNYDHTIVDSVIKSSYRMKENSQDLFLFEQVRNGYKQNILQGYIRREFNEVLDNVILQKRQNYFHNSGLLIGYGDEYIDFEKSRTSTDSMSLYYDYSVPRENLKYPGEVLFTGGLITFWIPPHSLWSNYQLFGAKLDRTERFRSFSGNHFRDETTYHWQRLTSVDDPNDVELIVYPNPVQSDLILETERNLINSTFQIFNSNGQMVKSAKLNESKINVSELPSGVFFIEIRTGENIFSKRFVKE